ncbi:AdoMet_MTases domain containing protein [Methylophilaceae bacterium]|jgi:2-polyprenyl-3-methyl-5-hydroxy-6-metoxy-1,4-benzoquinol methylase
MSCYLCGSDSFHLRKGQVRDAPHLSIHECDDCGLVYLSSFTHIQAEHYETSGMHGAEPITIEKLLRITEEDDLRRYEMLKSVLTNKKVLDFGCGSAGFLAKARYSAESIAGVEIERRMMQYWKGEINIYSDLNSAGGGYDLITAFHVVEHLKNPREIIQQLLSKLNPQGRLVIEVPNSDDALLTLYECDDFQKFTYWSQHLYLFNISTLTKLAEQAGGRIVSVQQHQRYPLSNHLYWLSYGLPGGHQKFNFIDSDLMNQAYKSSLAAVGRCDTLIAYLENKPKV